MRRKITSLTTAISVLFLMLITWPGTVLGQEKGYTSVYTLDGTTAVSGASAYGDHSFTQNNYDWHAYGNLTTNPWRIGLAKGSTNTTKDCPIYSQTAISDNITKIIITHGGTGNVTVNSMIVTIHSSSEDAATGNNAIATYDSDDITFVANGSVAITKSGLTSWAGKFYRIVYNITSDGLSNKAHYLEFESAVFYKTTYTITYDANGATEGSVPDATTHDAGSDATVANNTGSLVRTGFMFSGWNTQADGEGTDYVEGATINNIAQDYTLYAKWTSASTPNIVVSGDDISNNTLNLVYTESGDKTANASFNNMPEYTNPSVALFDDLSCETIFSGDWFSASLNGSTITYNASANPGAARTVYMRVSAVYNETTYNSNVITITQDAVPCTVTYDANGGSGTMLDNDSPYAYGSTVTILANVFTAPSGKVFDEWNTDAEGNGTSYDADDTFEITGNTTLYAQWSNIPTYTLVTSVSDIIPGAHYVIASSKMAGSANAMDAQNGDIRDVKSTIITVSDRDGDGNDDTFIEASDIYEFIISGYTNNYTIYDEAESKFLYHNSDKKVNLQTELTDAGKWKIAFSGDAIILTNVSATSYNLQYNSGSPRYTTYSSNQVKPFLYIKDNDTDIHPYSPTTYEEDVTINDVTITSSNKITVSDGATVTLTGTVSCDDPANLVIEDGGQLIASNSVAATVKKTIANAGAKDASEHWYTIASPVNDGTNNYIEINNTNTVNLTADSYDMFAYDEKAGMWLNQKEGSGANGFDKMYKGQGYLYRNSGNELSFVGNTNSGEVTYTLKKENTGDLAGFNLVGNPYPHDITLKHITYSKGENLNGCYVLSDAGAWGSQLADDATILPYQGFLVQADVDDKVAIFHETAQRGAKSNGDNIMFKVENSKYSDAAFALFDKGYGLNKIDHRNADIPMLYIPKDKQNFAIATMSDDTKSFNLNFKAMTTGKYTLSYKADGNFSYLHVIDRLTGEDVDMLLEGEYSFIASPSDAENRFIVRLEYSAGSESPESSVFAYQSGNDIIVNGEGELQIFDMMGRRVSTQYVSGVETINLQLNGVYVFRLNDKTQKIVVK